MSNIKIIIDKEKVHHIEGKQLTIVVPSADMSGHTIDYDGYFPLDFEVTTYHAQRVQTLHDEFVSFWLKFMENISNPKPIDYEITADNIRKMGSAAVHLMGLIDMTLKLQDKKIPVVWKYPESCMHPSWALSLGDLSIAFSNRIKT